MRKKSACSWTGNVRIRGPGPSKALFRQAVFHPGVAGFPGRGQAAAEFPSGNRFNHFSPGL